MGQKDVAKQIAGPQIQWWEKVASGWTPRQGWCEMGEEVWGEAPPSRTFQDASEERSLF